MGTLNLTSFYYILVDLYSNDEIVEGTEPKLCTFTQK